MTNGEQRDHEDRPVYFDNAATSWPKPPAVAEAVADALTAPMGNPGRAGHRMAIAAGRAVLAAREALAELFDAPDPARIVLTKNATEALNIAIYGLVRPGGRVITTSMEHNSVMRPLRDLEARGVDLTVLRCSPGGALDPELVRQALRADTSLVVTTHASNVVGTLIPIAEVAGICRAAGVPYLVDAAQTAGAVPISIEDLGLDLLAFSGHKGLLGPTGTGGLYVREGLEPRPITRGGTGSRSDEEVQPDFLPDAHESGTLNVPGFAGLAAGVQHLLSVGVERVRQHEKELLRAFFDMAADLPSCRVYGPRDPERQAGVTAFNLEGVSPSEVGRLLDAEFGIMSRIGLHCAPIAHRTIGTFPDGSVRFGWSLFNTVDEIAAAGEALAAIAARAGPVRPGGV